MENLKELHAEVLRQVAEEGTQPDIHDFINLLTRLNRILIFRDSCNKETKRGDR